MRKFIAILMFVFVALITSAQSVTLTPMPLTDTKFKSTNVYVLTNTTARTFIIDASKQWPTTQDFYIKLDSIGTGNHTNIAVALLGSKFADTGYSAIGSTINYKCRGADTTILISNATANRYNFYKWTVTGTGATAKSRITGMQLKLYLGQ